MGGEESGKRTAQLIKSSVALVLARAVVARKRVAMIERILKRSVLIIQIEKGVW